MVMRSLLSLVVLLLVSTGVLAATVDLKLDSTTVAWGKPLRGNLYYYGLPEPDAPDLSAWQRDFFVDPIDLEYDEDADGNSITRQSFRLYARATGKFTLASINWGGLSAPSPEITSTAAVADGAQISLTMIKSKTKNRVRVGQQLGLMLILSTTDPRVKPVIELPVVEGLKFTTLRPKKKVREPADSDQKAKIEHRFGWAITAIKSGHYQIELPPVGYHLHGRNLRRFYLPVTDIKVDPLPAYLPANIPVGGLAFTSRLVASERGALWQIDVESDARLPYGIPELRGELAAVSGIELGRVSEEIELKIDEERVITRIRYQLPLPQMLFGESPEISLNHFDLQTQRIQQLTHRLPSAWQYPLWLMILIILLGLLFSITSVNLLWRVWRRHRLRQALRTAILSCDKPQQLRQILLKESGQRTLSDWGNAFNNEGRAVETDDFIRALNRACFLPDGNDSALQNLKLMAIKMAV